MKSPLEQLTKLLRQQYRQLRWSAAFVAIMVLATIVTSELAWVTTALVLTACLSAWQWKILANLTLELAKLAELQHQASKSQCG